MRLPFVTNDLLGNSDSSKWAQPFTPDISSAFSGLIIALYGLCLQQPGFNGCTSTSFHRYLSKCLYSARVNGWCSSPPKHLHTHPVASHLPVPAAGSCLPSPGVFLGCTWGQTGAMGLEWVLYLYAGIPGLAIMMDSRWKRPSPKYLWRGEGELWHRETAAPHPRVHWFPKLQHSGDARNPSFCAGTQGHGRVGEAAMLGARRGAQTSTGWLGAAPSQWLVLDIAASISNRISSQQLHFKAFHSAALME